MGEKEQFRGREHSGGRRRRPRRRVHLALTFSIPALLLGAAPLDSPLTVALNSDIRGLDPGINRDANTDAVVMHMFEGLVGTREDGRPGLMLAKRISVSPDGRVYQFTLRSGLRFSNGEPLDAASVVWSWRRYINPATGWFCLQGFDGTLGARLLSVSAVTTDTIRLELDRPDPLLLARMAGVECGGAAILHRSSYGPDGKLIRPIATGPYRLRQWRRGEFIELERNPYYLSRGGPRDGYVGGKVATASQIRFHVIRDDAARLAALAKGQIAVLTDINAGEYRRLRRMKGVHTSTAPRADINAILIQTRDPLFRDPRIRRALAMAIDRRALTALVTADTGTANPSIVPAASSYHSTTHKVGYRYDPAAARRLLAAAGYKGQPITLTTTRRYPDLFDQSLVVQAMARQAGLVIKLEVLDWATELNRFQTGRYQLMSFSYSARAEPFFSYDSILGDRRVSKRKVWDNPAAIVLHRAAGATADPMERQRLLDQLHRLMIADVPLVVLFNAADINASRAGVEGFRSWMMGRARLWNVADNGGSA